jgi:hypothetical protein
MVSMSGSELDDDAVGFILDVPILVSSASAGTLRIGYLNPESAAGAGVSLEVLTPMTVWTSLRELPVGSGLVVDPDGERLVVAPDEVDAVLGGSRAESSILSRRRRAELASLWVLFHKDANGRPLSPVADDFGRRFAFAWTDQQAATDALSTGNSLVQVPLHVALRSNPDVDVILDAGSAAQLLIDAPLREQILYVTEYFPKGFLASVAELTAEARAPYDAPARVVAAAVRAAGIPLGGVWVVGYRLERAEAQIMIVVDADLDAAAAQPAYQQVLSSAVMPQGPTVALMRLSLVPESYHEIIRRTPDLSAAG